MKLKFYFAFLFFFIASVITTSFAQTQPVVVKGYVKNNNGAAVANKAIQIQVDSSIAGAVPCPIYRTKYTNANGYYIDTLICTTSGVITHVSITVINCTGLPLTQVKQVPANKQIEANFTLCNTPPPPPPNCVANFTFSVTGKKVYFLASGSNTAADTSTQYNWSFGDGTSKFGKDKMATHTYANNGIYTVCLAVVNPNCIDTFCAAIVIRDTVIAPPTCNITFTFNNSTPLQVKFNSSQFATSVGDSIVSRAWNFGDNTTLTGNRIDPVKNYTRAGAYNVCLSIVTAKGCSNSVCSTVVVKDTIFPPPPLPPLVCKAVFTFNNSQPKTVRFNSNGSFAGSSTTFGDSIISRVWNFGDSTNTSVLTGNVKEPVRQYARAGIYYVCLTITTAKGCVNTSCLAINVKDTVIPPPPPPLVCKAYFTYTNQATTVKFNSNGSFAANSAAFGDSIVSRVWNFGDSTNASVLTGNVKEPVKQYARTGIYNVCLTITTARGCVNTYCTQVIATNVVSGCVPQFFSQRTIGSKTVKFNSAASWAPANDSIVIRRWTFGDGTSQAGNVVSPTKTYAQKGVYRPCLTITTAKGCTNTYCSVVNVQDSIVNPPNPGNGVRIVSLSPVPARTTLNAMIWSIGNNVNATIGVYDIYGIKKFDLIRNLLQGNNVYNISVSNLPSGPYFLRVNTTLGNDSRPFYKL